MNKYKKTAGTCPVCDAPFLGTKRKKYCGVFCKNADLNPKYPNKRKPPTTKEETTRRAYAAAEARRRNMLKEVPDKMFLTIHEIVERRLNLPAQLISVTGVFKLMLKKTKTPKAENHVLNEALYVYIYEKLEEAGGVLTEFKSTAGTSRRWTEAAARAIFRFPPLKERKT